MSVLLTTKKIIKEWTDYNNHMNLSYYILVFDLAAEVMLSKFKMGEHSAITTKKSTMVVETHTTYNNEVKDIDRHFVNKGNRLIMFDADLPHQAQPVSRLCFQLRTCIVFKTNRV